MGWEFWDRKELYDLVWSQPMTHLAKEYAISDVGLRKVCFKLQIPVPTAGYWAKLRSGHKVPQPPLLAQTDKETAVKPEKRSASTDGIISPTILDLEKRDSYLAALSFERAPCNLITVRRGQPAREEIVQRTMHSLKMNGITKGKDTSKDILDIRVSPAAIDRATAIMDALLDAFHVRGWEIELQEKAEIRTMKVSLFDIKIPCWLEELHQTVPHVLSAEEEKDKKKNPLRYSRPSFDSVPTGRLAFKLEPSYSFGRSHIRATWADGQKQHLELILNKICTGIVLAAIAERNDDIRRAQWDRERQEEERKRKEAERLRLIEKARQKNLKESVESYESMLRIKRYLNYVRERMAEVCHEGDADLAQWLIWAEEQAKRHDPLAESFPRYNVEPAKEETNHAWPWNEPKPEPNNWYKHYYTS